MTMFSSKPARPNNDPKPYLDRLSPRGARYEVEPFPRKMWTDVTFDPRREFNHVQHNSPNPALLHFRKMHGDKVGLELHHAAVAWWASLPNLVLAGAYGYREGAHARRVLLRIANLTKEYA